MRFLFHFNEQGKENDVTVGAGAAASEEDFEAESSSIEQLKSMYTAEDNFSDLNLETMDHMTLSAHKFLLAARSPYFLLEDAVKETDFDGTIRMQDVNGKPLMTHDHLTLDVYQGIT